MKIRTHAAAALALAALTPGIARPDHEIGHTTFFADVPPPGFGEGIAADGRTVFVGTLYGFGAYATAEVQGREPSRVFLYDQRTGRRRGQITVQGEDLSARRGLTGMTFRDGVLYAAHTQLGVLTFRRTRGRWVQSVYATFADLPQCGPATPPCSPTGDDREPFPNDLTFDASGTLYVSDSWQATIWRVPPGGGPGEILFQDGRFDYQFGVNGLRIGSDGATLYFANTGFPGAVEPLRAPPGVYTVPLDDPEPDDVEVFHAFAATDAPDGIDFGSSGKLYVVSIGSSTVYVLNADGSFATSFPDPAANLASDHPYDFPSSLVFDDERRSILVVNYAVFTGHALPHHFVLRAYVGDTARAGG